MSYNPSPETATILQTALAHVRSVPYDVTARWVFYRLLQDGTLSAKSDYKKLLGFLAKARKMFHDGWTPWTLADDTRSAAVRGSGFSTGDDWVKAVARQVECNLDHWQDQEQYVEIWIEASAMEGQFRYYANDNISLLAFHGDVSIPEKWRAAERLVDRWLELQVPVIVCYYGDLDPKGLQIPISAENDVREFARAAIARRRRIDTPAQIEERWADFDADFSFHRIGLNEEQIAQYDVMENPERPGTYQWEGLPDDAAAELISQANDYVDEFLVAELVSREADVTEQFRNWVGQLELKA